MKINPAKKGGKRHFNVLFLTDVHETTDCEIVKILLILFNVVYVRQTDLLIAAGKNRCKR